MQQQKILIVDDLITNIKTIIDFIGNENQEYFIMQALNAESALEIADEEEPDIIITDWEMPGMDGIEMIKKIKQSKKLKNIPIIMCTGAMTTSAHLKTALDAGAIDFIRKPIDRIELIARINSALILADSYKKIANQNIELIDLNATKDKFFSIIAHDLRGPLGTVLQLTNVMRKKSQQLEPDDFNFFIDSIHASVSNSFKLLQNLLEWASIQTGKMKFNPIVINITPLIQENIDLLSAAAAEKKIAVQNQINTDIYAYVDKNMINTVIRNLLSNALKFTHKEGIVTIDYEEKDSFVALSIQDNGIGMTEEKIAMLFKTDRTISTKGTENEKGTGLGLILCNEFISKNKGSITVQSEKGKGSVFTCHLPSVPIIDNNK